jgi:hypothetical protein
MKISQTKVVPVIAKTLKIHLKVCDGFCAEVVSDDGSVLGGQTDEYVPGFMPGDHFGDYVILDIDLDTGQVVNWVKPTAQEIEEFIAPKK